MNWGKPSHWRERRAVRFAALAQVSAPAAQPSLHLDIERLTLSGVQSRHAPAIAQAVQAELARLATPMGAAPHEARQMKAGRIALGPTPEKTGRAIGAAVHKALWR